MKALFLTNGLESDIIINNILTTNFPQLELQSTDLAKENIIELLNESGQISLIIVNLTRQPANFSESLDSIIDCIGILPTIYICSPASIKSYLNEDILSNQKTNYFVHLPLNSAELKNAISLALKWIKEVEFEQSIAEFPPEELQPMRIRNFFIFNQMPYDVYLELTETRYGKIIQQNKTYSHQQIQNYAQKGVKYLYLRKDDNLKFLTTSIKNISKLYEVRITDPKKLILLHQQSVYFIREFIKNLNVTDEIVKLTQLFIESCANFITLECNLGEIIELVIHKRSISFTQQTLLNLYISKAILLKMGWNSELAFNKLALAAILQDIHLDNDDLIKVRSIHDPYFKSFSEEEQQEFLEHPEKAAAIARLFNGFPDVDFILEEHHESPSGEGFPKGVSLSNLTTISSMFILTNNFVAKLAQYPSPYSHKFLKEILGSLKGNFSSGNLKPPFKELEKIVKEITT